MRTLILPAALLAATLAAPLAAMTPASAWAHAQLRAANPPAGASLQTAPSQLEITYSEAVEPSFCTIKVTNAAGAEVDKGDLHTAPGDAKRLILGLPTLPPGTYKVDWHATSVDTHKTEGSYTFTVL